MPVPLVIRSTCPSRLCPLLKTLAVSLYIMPLLLQHPFYKSSLRAVIIDWLLMSTSKSIAECNWSIEEKEGDQSIRMQLIVD